MERKLTFFLLVVIIGVVIVSQEFDIASFAFI